MTDFLYLLLRGGGPPVPSSTMDHNESFFAAVKLAKERKPPPPLWMIKTTLKPVPEFLTSLPGEIRNQVFEYCIQDAVSRARKKKRQGSGQNTSSQLTSTEEYYLGFTIDALPSWTGQSRILMNGIGALPLLFTNKQIHQELSSLLYSSAHCSSLSLGGYILQFRNEDPTPRYQALYERLRTRLIPNLLLLQSPSSSSYCYSSSSITTIHIALPSTREDLFKGNWRALGFVKPPTSYNSRSSSLITPRLRPSWVSLIPSLVAFLTSSFPLLADLILVITIDTASAPDFSPLLPLYDIKGIDTVVELRMGHLEPYVWDFDRRNRWEVEWTEFLVRNGRLTVEDLG